MSFQLSRMGVIVYDFTAFSTSLGTFTACHRGVDVIIILCIYCYRDPAVCRLLHQYSMSVRLYCIQCLQLSTLGGRSICESARLGSVQTRFRIPISIQFPYKHCNVSKLFHNNKPSHWVFQFVVLKKYGNLEFGICFGRNLAERIHRSTARLI